MGFCIGFMRKDRQAYRGVEVMEYIENMRNTTQNQHTSME